MRACSVWVAAAALLVTTAAQADDLECRKTGASSMRCNQSQHDRMHQDFVNRNRNQLQEHEAFVQRMRDARREQEAKQERKWREALGKSVLEGRCEEAKRMALEHGDLAAADQAARLCVPATAAATGEPGTAPAAQP
jgi:hypothetical protein